MEYKLSDLFELKMGKTPSRSNLEYWNKDNNKWISISDLSKCDKYIENTKETISNKAVDESGIKIIPKNTVVMSFKLSIGKTAITSEDMFSNEAIMSFIDKKIVEINPEYLFYLLSNKNWDLETNKAVMGKTLNKAILSEMKIKILTIDQQKEIVKKLNTLKLVIKYRKKQISLFDDLVKSRFVEMFGYPISNDRKWNQIKLVNCTTKIGSGSTPKGGKESYISEGISLIRSLNVFDGTFEYKNLAHLTNFQAEELKNVEIYEGDVLFNITGASVTRSCVVPQNVLPARVNQHVCIIRCNKIINNFFLNYLLLNDESKKFLNKIAESNGATRQAITKKQLEDFLIICPPVELQNQFAEFVKSVDKSKVAVQKSLDELHTLYDSLMQEYFG